MTKTNGLIFLIILPVLASAKPAREAADAPTVLVKLSTRPAASSAAMTG